MESIADEAEEALKRKDVYAGSQRFCAVKDLDGAQRF